MAQTNNIYDPEEEQPQTHHDDPPEQDEASSDIGENTQADSNDGSEESLASKEKSAGKSEGSEGAGSAKESPSDLSAAESAASDTLGAGFTGAAATAVGSATGTGRLGARVVQVLSRNKGKSAGGFGIIGLIIAGLVLVFVSLVPLKIENIVKQYQAKFAATTENAVETQGQTMLDHYIADHVLPSYRKCGTTVTKSCKASVTVVTGNPVTNVYKSWADARLENTLAERHGIEFKYDSASKSWYLKAPGTSQKGDRLNGSPTSEQLDKEFSRTDRAGMRNAARQAMASETRWKQIYYHFKLGRLLEEKYGVRRCLAYCDKRDAFADSIDQRKNMAKLYLVQRVITPRSEGLGIVLECLLKPDCVPTDTSPTTDSDGAPANHGAPENPDTDTRMRNSLEELALQYGISDIAGLSEDLAKIQKSGFASYSIEKILTKLGFETAAGQVADKIPIVGWINQVAEIYNGANTASAKLKKLNYNLTAPAAVAFATMYRSYVDEGHSGNLNSVEFQSMIDSLTVVDSNNKADPIVGGTATLEQTPLYSYIMNGAVPTGSSSVASALLPSASAASTTQMSNYLCEDGKPVPNGKLVCSEEVFSGGNDTANAVNEFLNQPGLAPLTALLQGWGNTIGRLFNLASNFLDSTVGALFRKAMEVCNLPGSDSNPLCVAQNTINQFTGKIAELVGNKLIRNPFATNMSPGRSGDMIAAGFDQMMNDSAHVTLGGQKLTAAQTAAIQNEQTQKELQSFSSRSFFARMFSTDTQYSFVSRLAFATPLNTRTETIHSMATTVVNPFKLLGGVVGSITNPPKAHADVTAVDDPFGIPQYGYPSGTIPSDPETYWNQHCSDNSDHAYQNDAEFNNPATNWNQQAADNPDPESGQPTNTKTNPCMLIKAAAGAMAGKYDDSNLTADDLASPGSSQPTATNNKIYVLGDSLTVGMESAGLSKTLKAAGWQPTVRGEVGRTLEQGLTQAKSDELIVKESGTIVVELGTNNYGASDSSFNSGLKSLYDYIHSTNPTAQVFWVNYSASKEDWKSKLAQKNQLLSAFASANNISILDWAGSPYSKYTTDDTAMGIHPYQHYAQLAGFVADGIGNPPAATVGGGGGGSGKFTTNTSIVFPDVNRMLQRAATAVSVNKLACSDVASTCYHLCAHLAGLLWGYPNTGWHSAYIQWNAEKQKGYAHDGADKYNIPVGALMFWKGSGVDGHEAVYVGDGFVISTDVLGNGGVYKATATKVTDWMGSGTYLGWSNPVFNSSQTWPSIP